MSHDQNSEPSNDDESSVPALPASSRNVARNQLATVRSPVSGGLPPNLYRRAGFTSPPPAGAILNDKAFINTPFRLLPMYLPTLWNPVPGYDGGLNAAALIVNQFGVICIINAYLGQAEFDFISLRVNGTQVAFHTVTDDDVTNGNPIVLFINSSRLTDQANNTIQAFLTPLSGNSDQSPLFKIFVDRQLPVSPFPTFNKPYNENMAKLKFTDPLIEAFGLVTQAQMQLGTEVEIANYPLDRSLPQVHWRKEGDVITVSIGGATASHTVTAFEAASNDPIRFTLFFGFWNQVPDGVRLAEWNVRDSVGNPSPGASPPRLIQVDSGASTEPLLPPVFASESDYDPARDLDFIDTRNLVVDTPLELLIRNQGYQAGDTVVITVRGLAADGTSSEKFIDYPVTSITPIRVYIPLALDFLLLLSGGLILITYKRVRPGVPDRPSHGVLYAIDGEPVEEGLKAPIVLDLDEGALPTDTNPVRIVVQRYFGQLPNDRVDLIVTGLTADGKLVYATFTDIAGTGDLTFLLDNPFFAALNGGYFVAFYEINGAAQRPPSRRVTVPVGHAQAILPAPRTLQATPPDLTFDPAISLANLNARVDPHPVIVEGAQIRLFAIGTQPGGSFTSDWFNVDDNWEGSVVPFTVPRLIVLANLNSTMRLYYEVSPAPDAACLFSQDLVINVGMALKLPIPPIVLEATPGPSNEAELNPLHVLFPSPIIVTIRVPATDLLPTDDVTVHIVGMPGLGEPITPSKPGTPDTGEDYITFTVLSHFVAAYLGSFCEVFFTVMRNGNPVKSAILTLRVTALPPNTLDLVSVPEASGNAINVNATNHVKIHQWPFFKAGQRVFIELENTNGDLTLRDGLVVTAPESTAGRTLDLIPASYLSSLLAGSSMKIDAKVSLDGTGNIGSAVALKPVSYAIQKSGELVAEIPIGRAPHVIAFTPDGKKLYVSNISDNTISVIDFDQLRVVRTLSGLSAHSLAISTDGTRLYAPNYQLALKTPISVFNTANDSLVTYIRPGSDYLYACAINKINTKLLCSSLTPEEILVINVPGYSLNRPVPAGASIFQILTSPDGSFAYLRRNSPPYLQKFDYASESLGSTVSGLPGELTNIAFSHTRQRAYATTFNALHSINYGVNTIVGQLAGFQYAIEVACHPTRDVAYVTDWGSNEVVIVDTSSDTSLRMGTLNTVNRPREIGCSPDGRYVCVCNYGADTVSVFTA